MKLGWWSIAQGTLAAYASRARYTPPCFWQKSLQAVENKGNQREKESQERRRVRKPLTTWDLPQRHLDTGPGQSPDGTRRRGTPPGNADGCENKGVAEKGIRKNMKTKG